MSAVHGKGILAAVAAFLCATPATAQTVTVSYGYLQVKTACSEWSTKHIPERDLACINWEANFRDLVSSLNAQFAANLLCHGIQFTTLAGLYKEAGEGNALPKHWTLYLYPSPGQDLQSWVLFKSDMENDFRGQGRPNEIAREVCAVVAGRGGMIRK
jgi:hypothetical protein